MSSSFRTLVLSVAMLWALVPQIACFMPDPTLSESERDCCKEMANECGGTNMSHECCQTVVRPDAGTVAKMIRDVTPQFAVLGRAIDSTASVLLSGSRGLSVHDGHAPPHDPEASSLILRI